WLVGLVVGAVRRPRPSMTAPGLRALADSPGGLGAELREHDRKGRSPAEPGEQPHRPGVALRDRLHDRQAQPGAGAARALGPGEALEDALLVLLGDAHALVAHADVDLRPL